MQTDVRECIRNYFFGNFLPDTLNLLNYFATMFFDNTYMYSAYILYLTKKLFRYKDSVIDALQLTKKFGSEQVKLLDLAFSTLLFSHIFGCLWYIVGEASLHDSSNTGSNIRLISWVEAYGLN